MATTYDHASGTLPGTWSTHDFTCALVLLPDCDLWFGNETTCAHAYNIRKWRPTQRTATGPLLQPHTFPFRCLLRDFWALMSFADHKGTQRGTLGTEISF